MSERRWLKIGMAAMAVLMLLLIVARRDRGPVVEGRPLEAWVQDLLVTADPARHAAAQSAVEQFGTNALPWLQLALRHTDPVWKQPLLDTADKLPGIERHDFLRWVNPYERSEIRAGGAAGLAALGQAAAPAIPDLVESLGDPEHLVYNNALAALRGLGSLPLNEITNRLGHLEGGHRTRMLHVLRNMKSDAIGAAPVLVSIIEAKPGSAEANAAASALSTFGHRAAPVVMRLVASERYELRVAGFDVLQRLMPSEHGLWETLRGTFQLGGDREARILAALKNVWGEPDADYPTLSAAVLHGTAKSREAGIFLMREAARSGNAYERKLRKLEAAAAATASGSAGGEKTSSE
ncbi:MAG TPA: hypothetical protein QGG93_09005 [Verrucomicrobiota bacterium]|nr:hypothetical protein [Verrucomicrobiota bacterium]